MKGLVLFDLEGTLVDVARGSFSQLFISEDQLQALSKDYVLGIVTGATRRQLDAIFAHTYLRQYIPVERTVTVTEVSEAKKTGLPFQKIRSVFADLPAIVVGDSEGDVQGAQAIGVPCIQVDPQALQLLGFEKMEQYLKDVREKCISE